MLRFNAEQRARIAEVDGFKREANRAAKKARPKSPKATRGREVDKGFLQYLRRQPCEARGFGQCGGPGDPAHIRYNDGPERLNPGGGRRNHDRHCNPLCRTHHELQHSVKEQHFWSRLGKDAYETAAGHYAAYLAAGAPTAANSVGTKVACDRSAPQDCSPHAPADSGGEP